MDNPWVLITDFDRDEAIKICKDLHIPSSILNEGVSFPSAYLEIFCLNTQTRVASKSKSNYKGVTLIGLENLPTKKEQEVVAAKVAQVDIQAKDQFIAYCLKGYHDQQTIIQTQLKNVTGQLEKAQRELLALMKEESAIQDTLKTMDEQGLKSLAEKDLSDEFDALIKSKKIAAIKFDQTTQNLIVETNNIRHRQVGGLGTFRIKIDLTPRKVRSDGHYEVDQVNIEVLKKSNYHPHYDPDQGFQGERGYWCMGTATPVIAKALQQFQLTFVIDLIIQYLETG
jgi:hypothetical protein